VQKDDRLAEGEGELIGRHMVHQESAAMYPLGFDDPEGRGWPGKGLRTQAFCLKGSKVTDEAFITENVGCYA